jgi:hypothetical protein
VTNTAFCLVEIKDTAPKVEAMSGVVVLIDAAAGMFSSFGTLKLRNFLYTHDAILGIQEEQEPTNRHAGWLQGTMYSVRKILSTSFQDRWLVLAVSSR